LICVDLTSAVAEHAAAVRLQDPIAATVPAISASAAADVALVSSDSAPISAAKEVPEEPRPLTVEEAAFFLTDSVRSAITVLQRAVSSTAASSSPVAVAVGSGASIGTEPSQAV